MVCNTKQIKIFEFFFFNDMTENHKAHSMLNEQNANAMHEQCSTKL